MDTKIYQEFFDSEYEKFSERDINCYYVLCDEEYMYMMFIRWISRKYPDKIYEIIDDYGTWNEEFIDNFTTYLKSRGIDKEYDDVNPYYKRSEEYNEIYIFRGVIDGEDEYESDESDEASSVHS